MAFAFGFSALDGISALTVTANEQAFKPAFLGLILVPDLLRVGVRGSIRNGCITNQVNQVALTRLQPKTLTLA